jgi:hypothetical protein
MKTKSKVKAGLIGLLYSRAVLPNRPRPRP